MSIELTPPPQKAKEIFYAMYQKTKIATKKDVILCARIAIEYLVQIDEDNADYWREVKKELELIWI